MTLANTETFWRFWNEYYEPLVIDPYLEEVNFKTKIRVATGFSARVQKGFHGHGKQAQIGTVRAALVYVNAKIVLDTGQKTLHQPGSKDKCILLLQHMIK